MGKTTLEAQQVHRVNVMKAFLQAGLPLAKLDVFKDIGPKYLVSAMRDRVSANNVAMRTIKVVYSNVLHVGCFSHTLELVGNYFKLPNLTEFLKNWLFYSRAVLNVIFLQSKLGKR